MLTKRLIACLDVREGKLVKGINFLHTKEMGDPVEKAREYYADGLDELVFYDITASSDRRNIMLDVVERVAEQVFIPFSVGGGVRCLEDASRLRLAGAEKINVNSAAVQRPQLIQECAHAFGSQSTVLSMDVRAGRNAKNQPSGYEIVTHGGRRATGLDALAWAQKGQQLGAGELVINSIDADGTRDGYDIQLTRMIAGAVSIPVIASGGAGQPEHLYEVLTEGLADAALVASMVHYGDYTVSGLKEYLQGRGLHMRTRF